MYDVYDDSQITRAKLSADVSLPARSAGRSSWVKRKWPARKHEPEWRTGATRSLTDNVCTEGHVVSVVRKPIDRYGRNATASERCCQKLDIRKVRGCTHALLYRTCSSFSLLSKLSMRAKQKHIMSPHTSGTLRHFSVPILS